MAGTELWVQAQMGSAVAVLTAIWLLEAWFPLFADRPARLRHAGRNLAIGGLNLAILGFGFSSATVAVAMWTQTARFGLLNRLPGPEWVRFLLAVLLLDAWMYLWHRANHAVPFLWRFHRLHHADREVDVTTALRFHAGEVTLSTALRLAIIPLLGLELRQVIFYEALLLPVIAFHHSNIALPEALDRRLRLLLVSPHMHHVHHSDWEPETDSNFASIFSWWDRLGRSFRLCTDVRHLTFGLREEAVEVGAVQDSGVPRSKGSLEPMFHAPNRSRR